MMNGPIAIIGAGLSGCTLAYALGKDYDVHVFEQGPEIGGLCRTVRTKTCWHDLGPHLLYSRDLDTLKRMMQFLPEGSFKRYHRDNRVWHGRKLVKYPFTVGYAELDPADRVRYLMGYIERPDRMIARGFDDWLLARYGQPFCDDHFFPYNRKVWKYPLSEMSCDWVDRLPRPDMREMLLSGMGESREGITEQLFFWYPDGGIQRLPESIIARAECKLWLGTRVAKIEPHNGGNQICITALSRDGLVSMVFDRVLWTAPIHQLARMWPGSAPVLRDRIMTELRYNGIRITTHIDEWPHDPGTYIIYSPKREHEWHRRSNYRLFGSDCYTEETSIPMDKMPETNGKAHSRYVFPAYPIHTHRRAEIMDIARGYYQRCGITLCGRFAEHEYMNMDAVFNRAMSRAEEFKHAGANR